VTARSAYAAEALLYWSAASDARSSLREGDVSIELLADQIDEIDTISVMTYSPLLRNLCVRTVAQLSQQQETLSCELSA
jgi:hypothetical protein